MPTGSQALSTFKQEKVEAVEDSYYYFEFLIPPGRADDFACVTLPGFYYLSGEK